MEREYRYVSGQTRAANRAFLGICPPDAPGRSLFRGVPNLPGRIQGKPRHVAADFRTRGDVHGVSSEPWQEACPGIPGLYKGNAHLGTITFA